MKRFLSTLVGMMLLGSVAFADIDYGIEVGLRQQSGDVDAGSTKSEMAMQFGATAHMPISGNWHLRTGMLYTQRPLTVEGPSDNKVTMNYLDIPVAVMYKFEEGAGVFAGISLAMNLDKSADSGTVTDVTSPLIPWMLGASFKFHPQFGIALYYENASGKVAQGLKDYRAVGANLMITFD